VFLTAVSSSTREESIRSTTPLLRRAPVQAVVLRISTDFSFIPLRRAEEMSGYRTFLQPCAGLKKCPSSG